MLRVKLFSEEEALEKALMIFKQVIEGEMADPDNKGCLVANTTTELLPNDTELSSIIAQHKKSVEKIFLDFLLLGVKRGEISEEKDLKTMACLLYTLLTGLRVTGKTRPDQKESMSSVDAVLSLID